MNLFEKLKLDVLTKNVVVPGVARLGTLITGYLAGSGIPTDHSQAIGLGVAAAGMVAWDFIVDWWARRAAEKHGVSKALDSVAASQRAVGKPIPPTGRYD